MSHGSHGALVSGVGGNLLQDSSLETIPRPPGTGPTSPCAACPTALEALQPACSQDCLSYHNPLKVAFFLIVATDYFEN